jgi:transcriptional regulator with XRE-family HTH domain
MQNKPDFLDQLIDRASKEAGSDYALSKRIGVGRQTVSDWRHGRRPCPAADVALMAHIAGLDADAWASRALIAQYEGTEKGEALKKALKKALAATGAALVSSGAIAQEPISYLIRCIERLNRRRVFDSAMLSLAA